MIKIRTVDTIKNICTYGLKYLNINHIFNIICNEKILY